MQHKLAVTFDEQVAELDREIATRKRVFPKWVAEGKIADKDAAQRMARLVAARETFAALIQYKQALPRPLYSLRFVDVET